MNPSNRHTSAPLQPTNTSAPAVDHAPPPGLARTGRRAPAGVDLQRYAAEALSRGLFVQRPDGSRVPIRPVLEPTVSSLEQEGADAHVLLGAAAKAAERLAPEELGALKPLERACVLARRSSGVPLRLVTGRVDFMQGRVLEINATIPAMQGYADLVVEALLAACGAEALIDQNGSNIDDLLRALREIRPGARLLAIVARAGDSQWGELTAYARRFCARGLRTLLVTPEQVRLGPRGLEACGEPVDLCYRHVFTWRLEPDSDFARALVAAPEHFIVNPVALDLEAKATLAELSRAAAAPAAEAGWLTAAEREVIRRRVPWTRRLDAVLAGVAERDRERLVLKRSWDYGGRGVVLGVDTDPERWRRLLEEALRPGDVWVVQELVDVQREQRTLIAADGGMEVVSAYADLCAFTSLGLETVPRGGASRVAARRVVNLLGGGGLAPVLLPEVAAQIGAIEGTETG